MISSLCFPDSLKSCFACCPPIRPAGYDHSDHKNIIKRILLENSSAYKPGETHIKPVTGFSCWAMGYLDKDYKQPGCLLHPYQNKGNDLRYRIDYGNKCEREYCYEAGIFEMLNEDQKRFWLNLTRGMDSFEYSSRKTNILFHLLGWGHKVLANIADNDSGEYFEGVLFIRSYPFFKIDIFPKGYAYLLTYMINKAGSGILKDPEFEKSFRHISEDIISGLTKIFCREEGPVFVHRMEIDPLFTDFLRLSLEVKKSEMSAVKKIKQFTDKRLKQFCRDL